MLVDIYATTKAVAISYTYRFTCDEHRGVVTTEICPWTL